MNKMFYTTRDLADRWGCSERTVFRMMKPDRKIPLPLPDIQEDGASNRWLVSTIEEFDVERMNATKKKQVSH